MKIAKKVLAVAMAVAMIACFAAMAFAADAKLELTAGEIANGTVKVQLVATDYADFKSADWVLTYDADALTLVTPANPALTNPANGLGDLTLIGTDAVALAAMGGNLITAYNTEKAGEIQIGFAFKETLASAAATVLFTVEFTVADGAKNVDIKLANKDGSAVDALVLLEVEETTAAPTTEPTTAAPTTEAPSTPAEVTTAAGNTDKGPSTGDTGVLAIAAGVVALAGAAFVVTKKRK